MAPPMPGVPGGSGCWAQGPAEQPTAGSGGSTCDEPSCGRADTRLRVHRCPEMQSNTQSQTALGPAGASSCPHPLPRHPPRKTTHPLRPHRGERRASPQLPACSGTGEHARWGGRSPWDPCIARQPRRTAGDQGTSSGTHQGPPNLPPKILQSPLTTQSQRGS